MGHEAGYLDYTGRDDVIAGGVRMIPVETPKGTFRVWTKRIGNNPTRKLLLLHGGPGATHEYFEGFDSYLPAGGVEYYYYDQLGSTYSDQPDDDDLWEIPRFVDEVDQVRRALGLNRDNFFLLGQSWGGILVFGPLAIAAVSRDWVNSSGTVLSLEVPTRRKVPRSRALVIRAGADGSRVRGDVVARVKSRRARPIGERYMSV